MRITKKHLQAKVAIINGMLGYDALWNTVGAVRLYCAYGGYGVHRVVNTAGGVDDLLPCGTAREASMFLQGMIAALRIAWEESPEWQAGHDYL